MSVYQEFARTTVRGSAVYVRDLYPQWILYVSGRIEETGR